MIDATVPVAWDDPGEKGESGRNKKIREKGENDKGHDSTENEMSLEEITKEVRITGRSQTAVDRRTICQGSLS